MQRLSQSLCSCRKPALSSPDRCPACAQARQKRLSNHHYAVADRGTSTILTPPPSRQGTPRRSLEQQPDGMPSRSAFSMQGLTSALASEDDDDEASPAIFPRSVGRTPAVRSGSRQPSGSPPTARRMHDAAADVGYAPFAAGFARLSRKDELVAERAKYAASSASSALSLSQSARPSLELEARMFSGPA